MNVLEAYAKAQAIGSGKRISPGSGVLILDRLQVRNGYKGTRVVFDFVVESSTGEGADKPGESVTEMQLLDGSPEKVTAKMNRVKTLLEALGVTDADAKKVLPDAEQTDGGYLLRGVRVGYSAWMVDDPPPKPGQPKYVGKKWIKIEGQTAEQIADGRARVARASQTTEQSPAAGA